MTGTAEDATSGAATQERDPDGAIVEPRARRAIWRSLSPANIGAIYVWILIIALFWVISPNTFPTSATVTSVLSSSAVTALVALALVVPLAASYYDLSIGYTMSIAGIVVTKLLTTTSMSIELSIAVTLAVCVVIGLMNAVVVVGLGIDSFIGTLGTGAVLAALAIGLSGNATLTVIGSKSSGFSSIANNDWLGLQHPVFFALAVMLILAFWLERTAAGRRLYATGFDREAARLTGIRVLRLGVLAFICSATLAGFAGVVLASTVASAAPDQGVSYLIPAFSAAFLGATQFRHGRFNPWGTVLAVLLIGTGNVGLLISGGPVWATQLFQGVVLIAAVGLTSFGRSAVLEAVLRRRAQSQPRAGPPSNMAPPAT